MHNGMIQLTGEKMAKSAGNIAPLYEVVAQRGAQAVVMYLLSGHYRQPLAFSDEELEEAERRLYRIRNALRGLEDGSASPAEMAHFKERFFDALADDFNTPRALAALFEWLREANRRGGHVGAADLREMLDVLGLGGLQPLEAADEVEAIDAETRELFERRQQARDERDFDTADRMRELLRERGWEIRDGPEGSELVPALET
jgi:cysteinyl-tRNA synthetase